MSERRFVSRAGEKLEHALHTFDLSVAGLRCADFGCNVGGFTDCLKVLLSFGANCEISERDGGNRLGDHGGRTERIAPRTCLRDLGLIRARDICSRAEIL